MNECLSLGENNVKSGRNEWFSDKATFACGDLSQISIANIECLEQQNAAKRKGLSAKYKFVVQNNAYIKALFC